MIRLFVFLFLLSTLSACIDRVQLPIRTEEPRLVVEGQITNEAPPYSLKLTYTGQYGGPNGQNSANQSVMDAEVKVADDQGRSTRYVTIGPGTYQTADSTFRGQIGRAYSLTVVLSNGKRYISQPERMPAVPPIDSVSTMLTQVENVTKPFQYAYSISTRDPTSDKNYYRWTAYGLTNRRSTGVPCCTGCPSRCFDRCWVTLFNENVNIFSDEAVNGNSFRRAVLQLPVYATGPQFMEVEQYGITQANYQFWKLYQQQNARTGSIFDPLPAPITGNLINSSDPTDLARGYFAVTSVTRKRYRNDALASNSVAVYGFVSGQIAQGDCRATYGPVPTTLPPGW